RVGLVVDGYQRAFLVAEDAMQLTVSGGFEQLVDRFGGGGLFHFKHAIGERGIGQRHPHRVAVEAAFQFREDFRNGGGGAGGGGDEAHAAGPRPAQVLVGCVEDGLGVGEIVDGGHRAVADTQVFMDHLDHRRQAVGGAGGGGDNAV